MPPRKSDPSALREVKDAFGEVQLRVSPDLWSRYEDLLLDWVECERCPLHATRNKVVFVRGSLPADVLFLGEAPGPTEDQFGFPFVGPSGRLLSTMLRELEKSRKGWTYAIANPVGCVPWYDDDGVQRFRQPHETEVNACSPRFVKLLELANPTGIVLMGKVAESYWARYGTQLKRELSKSFLVNCIQHPSYILRNGGARDTNTTYRTAMSSLKQFLFQKIKVAS